MDVHQLRLQLLLGCRPQGAHQNAEHSSRVSAKPGYRVRSGNRLSRLAYSTGAPVPVTEVVVRDPALRGAGLTASHSRACPAGEGVRALGAGGRKLRTGRACAAESGVLPA